MRNVLSAGQAKCKKKACEEIELAIKMAILDGGHVKSEIKANGTNITSHEEEINELESAIKEVEEAYDGIHDEVEVILKEKEVRQHKLKKVTHEKMELDKKVRSAARELEKLIKEEEREARKRAGCSQQFSSSSNMSSNGSLGSMIEDRMVIEKFDEDAPEEWNKKHTGKFGFNHAIESFCWSCCLCENYRGPGCIDDQSVGILEGMTERPAHIMRPHTHSSARPHPIMWMRTAQPPSPFANPPEWPVPKHKVTKNHHSLKIRPSQGWDGTHPPKAKNIETLTPNRLHMKSRGSLSGRNGGLISPSGGFVHKNNNASLASALSSHLEGDSADQVFVGADLSLHRRESPMKSNKTNLSKTLNSSSLVSMSRINLRSPVGKAVCIGDRRPFIGAGNRMLTRPHTANAGHNLKKYTGDYAAWGSDDPVKYVGPLDARWNTCGTTTHTLFAGPVKQKPESASKNKKQI